MPDIISTIVQPNLNSAMPADRTDVIERLPPSGQTKLRCLREKHEALRAIERSTSGKLEDALAGKQHVEGRMCRLQEDRRVLQGGDDHPSMVQALSDLKRATDEMEYRQELLARHCQPCRQLGSLIANSLEPYLMSLPAGIVLEPYIPRSSPLGRGERPENALMRIRAEAGEFRDTIEQVRRAPNPSAEAKARVRAQVEDLRQRSAPDVHKVLQNSEPAQFRTTRVSLPLVGVSLADGTPFVRGDARGQITDTVGLMAWLFPEQLVARLEAEIAAHSDDEAALSADERKARTTELRTALLDAERREEAVICLLENSGVDCVRRLDSDPRAVLGIVGPPLD